MIIGIPKEIKIHEYRIGMTPPSVRELTSRGHTVLVESESASNIGFLDQDYLAAGAAITSTADEIYATAELIVKVKEPQPVERLQIRPNQALFTYFHLAPDLAQTTDLIRQQAICIAYETVTDNKGGLPLLTPMSEIAGRMSIQAGAAALELNNGGSGILLSGVPGVAPGNVVILGGGVVGSNAARIALGMRADVTIIDKNPALLRQLDTEFNGRVKLIYSTQHHIEEALMQADLVVGSVLIPGDQAPKLITRNMLCLMKKGSVIVDVAIDQGGCTETSTPTTHQNPTYTEQDIVHYCVTNMPGAVAKTATQALNNATLPYIIKLADLGIERALQADQHLRNGLNLYQGKVTCEAVAHAHHLPYIPADKVIF